MPRFRSPSILPALRFFVVFCAVAATLRAQTPPAVANLAVEILIAPGETPSIAVVEQDRGVDTDMSTPRFLPLRDFESKERSSDRSSSQSPVEPSNLDLTFRLHGDVMDIAGTLSFVPVSEREKPKERGKYPIVELGKFQGRLGDTISLDKMIDLGFQPVTIKIVSAERHSASLPIVTHVPSITARVASQDSAGYRISLHNLSAQGVMALTGRDALKGGNTLIAESRGGIPMIAGNGNDEFPLGCDESRDMGPTDSDMEPVPCAYVLEAALFADGSYEGDVDSAAMLDLGMLSRKAQLSRVRRAMQAVLDDKDVPESSRFAQMEAAVSNLTYVPDPTIREQLRLKFPGVSESVLARVDGITQTDFHSRQTATLMDLHGNEKTPSPAEYLANLLASPEMN